MDQKHFYQAFNLLYQISALRNGITTKEDFYILLFRSTDEAIYGNGDADSIRRITSGKSNLRVQTAKRLQTAEGFELLRKAVETYVFTDISDCEHTATQILDIVKSDHNIPSTVKAHILETAFESTYTLSRSVTAALVCLNYSDYMMRTGTAQFIDIVFMRLYDNAPPADYPIFLTDYPSAGVDKLIGREDDIDTLYEEINEHSSILVSAVGGLGKTELIKALLDKIHHTKTADTNIEYLAWIPYDNHDLRASIKRAFDMEGDDDDDVWAAMKQMAEAYRHRLLLVIDNIEKSEEDVWLNQLSSLPCRVIATSRQRSLRGFTHTFDLQPLTVEQCRTLFYYHYNDDKAKNWFGIKKNSILMRLFHVGMLEHSMNQRKHIYWMHSVIAAAVREQQKALLYDTVSPFMHKISEELEYGDNWGKGYTKLDLIPFSWSIADIMEDHLGNEDDATFLLRLFYVCFDASNYPICRQLIEKVLEIDLTLDNKEALIRDYKNYGELLLRIDDADNALIQYDTAQKYMLEVDPEQKHLLEWAYLWHKYGNYYYHIGNPGRALDYYYDALEIDLNLPDLPPRELATDYASIAEIYKEYGDLNGAYEMLTKAIQTDVIDEEDSENTMLYFYMATLCGSYVNLGYNEYVNEGERCFRKVIEFREESFDQNSQDLADVYLEYANFCKDIEAYDKATEYCQKAASIYRNHYGEYSYHMLQCTSTNALILSESGHNPEAIDMYGGVIQKAERISNYPPTDLCRDYQNFADILENSDLYDEVEEYYLKAINLVKEVFAEDSPNLAQLYLDYASCLMGKEDYPKAIQNLKKLEQFIENDRLLERVMEHKLGTCYCLLNDYPEGVKHFLNAAKLCEQNQNGSTDIGYIAVDLCIA